MARHVDGFVMPVPKKNRAAYARMARLGRKVWMDHGALEYHECVMDPKSMPFDGMRMFWGGFKAVVSS